MRENIFLLDGYIIQLGGKELTAAYGWYTSGAVSTGVLVARKTLFSAITETCVVAAITVLWFTVDAAVVSIEVWQAGPRETKGKGHV